jgi:glutamate synthase domain-containing protein 3
MTGGVLFAMDPEGMLERRIHSDWVCVETGLSASEELWVRELIVRHIQATGSRVAERIHVEWAVARHRFHRVSPVAATRANGSRMLPLLSRTDPPSLRSPAARQLTALSARSAPSSLF